MPKKKATEEEVPTEEILEGQVGDRVEPETDTEPVVENISERKGRMIKFMGSSDIRNLLPGETLLFRHPPLERKVEWHYRTGHLVNTADYPEVPDAFWDELLKFTDFKDVTKEYRSRTADVPKNKWEEIWQLGAR